MDSVTKPTEVNSSETAPGIYVRGLVVSNEAKVIRRKDGSGISVIVSHEIALKPGIVTWTRFMDPGKDTGLTMAGETVVDYPRLKELQPITLRVTKIEANKLGQLVVRQAEVLY